MRPAARARIPWRSLPRSVRIAALLHVGYGALFGLMALSFFGLAVLVAVGRDPGAPWTATVATALLVASVLHFRAAPRLEAGSATWWLVGLGLAVGQGTAWYAEAAYAGRDLDLISTFVFPGMLATALLWPSTVRHVHRDHHAISDVPDEELGRAPSGG